VSRFLTSYFTKLIRLIARYVFAVAFTVNISHTYDLVCNPSLTTPKKKERERDTKILSKISIGTATATKQSEIKTIEKIKT